MRVLKFFGILLVFCILTFFTQVGGILYLLSIATYPIINRRLNKGFTKFSAKLISFLVFYLVGSLMFVPTVAKPFGRVPLPMFETSGLKPRTIWTCLLNRNYCRPVLRNTTFSVATKMQQQYPGTVVNYLDASFPLGYNYPILPHLSHGDGRKLDVALCYIDRQSGNPSNTTPSFTGYGVYEGPRNNEVNQQWICKQKGFWQGDFLPGEENDHKHLMFDELRTKSLTNYFAEEPATEKIFIEPHLEMRLRLKNPKVRFQGCHAARHDDHIHVQVK